MSERVFEVLDPGLLTTVQDRGRYGYQRFGVPVAGAMDVFSLRAANILVGNDQNAACLEMTGTAPKLRVLADTIIAVTGGDLAILVDDAPLPRWAGVRVSKGSVLTSEGAEDGFRAYLAVAGGIDVPVVLGSRSTYMKSGLGGFEGRALKQGDILSALPLEPGHEMRERGLPMDLEPLRYGNEHELRVVPGPQDNAFASEGLSTLFSSQFTVSSTSDRVGYRLEGPKLKHKKGADIISDGSPLGAVQVPGDGSPIILLADRGPTGGYAKIATVISIDVGRLAQAAPGDTVTFKQVTVEEAQALLKDAEAVLRSLDPDASSGAVGGVSILVDGQEYEVSTDRGAALFDPLTP
ncbi:MAG: biotin-dependent carboxyltransferase family protein, partial [SAR202 cluster bacterium]|nr:biotin-dependent carboxyltransferase family protein [SAR202 cluster bacterium]